MWERNSFEANSFSDSSWLYLLSVPYGDLNEWEQFRVRSVLERVVSLSVVERIVACAEENNVSVLEAAKALTVSESLVQHVSCAEQESVAALQVTEQTVSTTREQVVRILTEE